jgi:hypothetical protein
LFFFNKPKSNLSDVIVLGLFTIFILVYGFFLDIIVSNEVDFIGFGFTISIFLGYLLSSIETKEHFFHANEKLVQWSLLIGIPIFLLIGFFPSLLSFAPYYNFDGFEHQTFFVTNIHYAEEGLLSYRFVGFGREPGVTQFFYILALWSSLKKHGKFTFSTLLIILAIFLGRSTAGFFMMVIVVFFTIPIRKNIKYILFSSPFFIFLLINEFNYHIDNKLSGTNSFINRYERYFSFFSSDVYNVVFGFGNTFYKNSIGVANLGGWDTFLQLSQRYGIITFVFLAFILFLKNRKFFMVSLIIFITFFSQLIWFYPAIAFFYFKGRSNCIQPNKQV